MFMNSTEDQIKYSTATDGKPPVIRRRHKWERTGHTLNHEWTCVKCGCVKDANRLFSTEYRLNGETFENAPSCPAAFL